MKDETRSCSAVGLAAWMATTQTKQGDFGRRVGCTSNYVSLLVTGKATNPSKPLRLLIEQETGGFVVPGGWDQPYRPPGTEPQGEEVTS